MVFLKNKIILFETIFIAVVICSVGIYVVDFNNSHFEQINNINLTDINQWNHGKRLEITESNGIMQIVSSNNVSGSWPILNSRGSNVYKGETILLSVYAQYTNTAQSSLRIVGNTSKGQQVLGYAFIVDGNSNWHEYSLKITIPGGVTSIFVQLPIGWVISNHEPEVITLKDLLIYNIK